MVYFVMALTLFADEDYEEVAARLTQALRGWGYWEGWEVPTKGAVTQARQRLRPEVMAEVVARVAGPVAGLDTAGAFLGRWRLMSVDGMEWDVPDTAPNRDFFGSAALTGRRSRRRGWSLPSTGSPSPGPRPSGPRARPGPEELLFTFIDADRILFGSEMIGAVRGINPTTGHYFDDTRRYIDALGLSPEVRDQVYELSARRIYPRLGALIGNRP
jgi:Insertion element 4 transposase N-terminal/Amidohydrolase